MDISDPYIIPFKNVSGETIQPFSVMRPISMTYAGGIPYYTVGKPNTTFQRYYLVNGPNAIPNNGHGLAGDGVSCPIPVYTENVVGQAFGDQFGVQNNSWKLNRYYPGNFTFLYANGQMSSGFYVSFFRQAECNNLIVKTTEAFDETDGFAEANIQIGGPTLGDSGLLITIYDKQYPTGPWWTSSALIFGVSFRAGLWHTDWFEECA